MRIVFILIFLVSTKVWSYPEFIGFGYRSCLICHESGSGGGALTDYARGVYASEIADNPFALDEEEVVRISNFLGGVEFPWWVRLGFKYRSLMLETDPGSSNSAKNYLNMQNDFNINFYANEEHTISFINTIGYLNNPFAIAPNKAINDNGRIFMKEYFIKYKLPNEFWLQAGFMDKVFGIKTVNHTSVNRAPLSLGQNDQVHALQLQWALKNEDLFLQYWLGNTHLSKSDQSAGGSIMFEQKWGAMHAYGVGVLQEKKESYQQSIFEIHNKMGFGKGNSLLMELGYKKAILGSGVTAVNNSTQYLFTQGNLNLRRGLFFLSGIEYAKNDSSSTSLDSLKWDLGILAFPVQRMELRISGVNQKTYNATEAAKDTWIIQSQIHLSL